MAQPSRPSHPKPLADLLDKCLDKAMAAQGFANSDVIASWPDIVGERLAGFSQPIKMEWPRRASASPRGGRSEPAALVVRVEGAFAIEMQHLAPLIVERVNTYYGWRCVGRLVLKQGPVRRPVKETVPEFRLSEPERSRVEGATETIAEEPLRKALDRLGTAILATERRGAGPG
jgi:hypothetical protein